MLNRGANVRPTMLAAAVSSILCAPAMAQSQTEEQLPEVLVTAQRIAAPESRTPVAMSVLTAGQLDKLGIDNAAGIGKRLSNVHLDGAPDGLRITIRGVSNSDVTEKGDPSAAFMLDGIYIARPQAQTLSFLDVDRIEVLRGPAAAVYGSDAVGGVIQLFTRRGEEGVSPYAGIGFGSKGLRRIEGGVSGKSGLFDYSFGVAHEDSKGYNVQPVSKRNVTKDGFTSPDRDGYNSTSGNAKLGFQITPDQRIEATLLSSDIKAGYDATVSYRTRLPFLFANDISSNTLQTAGLSWSAKWNDVYSTRVQVTDSQQVYKTQPSFYRTETKLRGYLFQNEFRFGPHLVTATLERREDALENAPTTTSKLLSRDRSQDAVSLGYGFVKGPHSLQLHVRHDKDSEFGGKTTGSAAYGYAITPTLRFTASAGTAFRVPTLYQRFSEYGLATLKPESSRNLELGLQYTEGATQMGIVAYANRVQNLIVFDGSAKGCASSFGCYASTARARYQGVTLSGSHRIGDVTLRGSFDFQDPRDLATHNLLARRAQRHATLGADWRIAGWTLGAEVQTSSRRYDDAANSVKLGGYTVLNLSATTQITRDINLVARVDNVGNKDYQFARLYANAGRTAYVGLKWTPH